MSLFSCCLSKYGLKPKGDYDGDYVAQNTLLGFASKYGLKPKGDYDDSPLHSVRERLAQGPNMD